MKKMVEIQMHSLTDLMAWHVEQAERNERLAESHTEKYGAYGKYGDTVIRQDKRRAKFHRMAAAVVATALEETGNINVQAGRSPNAEFAERHRMAPPPASVGASTQSQTTAAPASEEPAEVHSVETEGRSEEDRLPSDRLSDLARRARATPGSFWPSTGT